MMHSVASSSKKHKDGPHSTPRSMGMMGAPTSDCESDEESTATGSTATKMPKIRVGNRNLTMHTELVEMTDSTEEFKRSDFISLRAKLDRDGFLFVRGVLPRETVRAARGKMLKHLDSKGAIRSGTDYRDAFIEYQSVWDEKNGTKSKKSSITAKSSAPASMGMMSMGMMHAGGGASCSSSGSRKMIPGWTVDAESGGIIGGREPDSQVAGWFKIGNSEELTNVYNGPALKKFYTQLFSHSPAYASRPHMQRLNLPPFSALPSCTWLRAKGPGEVTAEHADYYYFYKNTHIFRDFWRVEPTATPTSAKVTKGTPSSSSTAATRSIDQSQEEKETCQVCHDARNPESTLICDLCDHGYHIDCLSPRLASLPDEEQEWHCYSCQNLPMEYWTCWTPLADISGHDGRLALIPGSHRLGGYEAPVREDLLPKDFTKSFENKSIWQTPTTIGMGDIILFNIKTIHAATKNAGEKFRLSLDTRVTTCFGPEYCEQNGIESLQSIDEQAGFVSYGSKPSSSTQDDVFMVDAKSKQVGSNSVSAAKGKVDSFFPAAKKQKRISTMG